MVFASMLVFHQPKLSLFFLSKIDADSIWDLILEMNTYEAYSLFVLKTILRLAIE
jgi:hypothetical protein